MLRRKASPVLEGVYDVSNLAASYHFAPETENSSNETSVLERRVTGLDEKVTEILDQVRWLTSARSLHALDEHADVSEHVSSDGVVLPASDVVRKSAELYLQFCHCQPLPLFDPRHFVTTIDSRDIEIRLCIAGLAMRFDREDSCGLEQQVKRVAYLRSAQRLVMKRIADGNVELSTLQSLCLLSMSDYNDGRRAQSGIHLSLATELARTARLELYSRHKVPPIQGDEHNRCLWSIIMLQYLAGSCGSMILAIDTKHLRFPESNSANELASTTRQINGGLQEASPDLGIEAYAIQMTEAWYEVREWTYHQGKLDENPPWSGQSHYHKIMLRQMELESRLPYKHRFKPSGFSDHAISDLSVNRTYWAPWLYLQVIYHAIVCTLNHPLLLSIHLRRFRVNQIPELFLQHIADLISSHTDWIIHLLNVANEKQFQFSDPYLGRCVAIAATIFLQQSYTEDAEKRIERQAKYSTCLKFVEEIGKHWPHVSQLAIDLRQFERIVSRAYEFSTAGNSPNLSNHVDLTAFWSILDFTQARTSPNSMNSIFGVSLRLKHASTPDEEILSSHPIPEPTRVQSLSKVFGSTSSTPVPVPGGHTKIGQAKDDVWNASNVTQSFEQMGDSPFLAQNFFALGQDFVGNADDWFTWTDD